MLINWSSRCCVPSKEFLRKLLKGELRCLWDVSKVAWQGACHLRQSSIRDRPRVQITHGESPAAHPT